MRVHMPTGCSTAPEYRWMLATSVVRDWSAASSVVVTPAATATYRLDVRCGNCASGVCVGSSDVMVTVDPNLKPADLGNTLWATKGSNRVDLVWGADLLARSYVLHRGDTKGVWPAAPLHTGLASPVDSDGDPPPATGLFLYRATGASCSGNEGP